MEHMSRFTKGGRDGTGWFRYKLASMRILGIQRGPEKYSRGRCTAPGSQLPYRRLNSDGIGNMSKARNDQDKTVVAQR